MTISLPSVAEFMDWPWEEIEPLFRELNERTIDASNVDEWLADWSTLDEYIAESFNRLYVATGVDTTDKEAEARYNAFLDDIFPQAEAADQILKEQLISSGVEPTGFEVPLRNMRTEVELFREKNLPLKSKEFKLSTEYDKIVGAQTITWDGKEITLDQLKPVYQEQDRSRRESAWKSASERQLADREAINELWGNYMDLRQQMTTNADHADYRSYCWKQYLRFDYTPDNAKQFNEAIHEVVVPVAQRIYEKRRKRLDVQSLRPWDLYVDPSGRSRLRPFETVDVLENKSSNIFRKVDPQLGDYFDVMREEDLLDLDNRKGKAPGGYCTDYTAIRKPFIFMNAVGIHDDVQTMLHEGGHAFHVFESARLPYIHQMSVGMEFAEVASMAMELLSAPYLTEDQGGFYTPEDAARARIEHLEGALLFWPYMSVVDSFQHWVYENHAEARDPDNCNRAWGELWDRFMMGVDWSGLEAEKVTGWHRKLHIHQVPFYYIEYGLAQLGAMQVWRNAIQDQAGAVAAYRKSLALGGTVPLPELFTAAGAKFAFDAGTLRQACELAEITIQELESVAN